MAKVRGKISLTIINAAGEPVTNATATITHRATGAAALWYNSDVSTTGATSPVNVDAVGRINAWVDRGAYNVLIQGTGITPYTEAIDVTPAADNSADYEWISTDQVPVGILADWVGPSDPPGGLWLVCDGRTFVATAYPVLAALIGTTFGGTSTNPALPNLRGRGTIGAGAGVGGGATGTGAPTGGTSLTNRIRGSWGGAESVLLAAAQSGLPAHGHAVSDPGHAHSMESQNFGGAAGGMTSSGGRNYANAFQAVGTGGSGYGIAMTSLGAFTVGFGISPSGTGLTVQASGTLNATQAHENMIPWMALHKIVRAK